MPLRLWSLVQLELRASLRRPMWWVLAVVLLLLTWGLSSGSVRIGAGASSATAQQTWLNSQFNLAWGDVIVFTLLYAFFISVAFGNAILDDEEHRVGPVLHSTQLTTAEYVLGRFMGVAAVALCVMALHLVIQVLFFQMYPVASPEKVRGPFEVWNFVRPFLLFVTVPSLCLGAVTFAVGAVTRQAIVVFLIPVALLAVSIFFLWDWSPEWLSAGLNRALCVVDATGFRWLNETWLKADRGADFYNHTAIPLDGVFLLNRAWMVLVAAAFLAATCVVERRRTRHPYRMEAAQVARVVAEADAKPVLAKPALAEPGLSALQMEQRYPRWMSTMRAQVASEARELRRSPGLWIFVPIITLEVVGGAFFRQGPFDTPMLITPGLMAAYSYNTVTLLSLLLVLFYATESLARDDRRRMAALVNTTPAHTSAILLGKLASNVVVVLAAVLTAIFAALLLCLAIQGVTSGVWIAPSLTPLLQAWGLCLLPTVIVWLSFVSLMWALTRNRYAVYGAGLGLLIVTGWLLMRGWLNWVGNWHFWSGVRWTDFGAFELDWNALALNRIFWLLVAALMFHLSFLATRRRMPDASGIASRLRPMRALKTALRVLPEAAAAAVAGIALAVLVRTGGEGGPAERLAKDYFRRNQSTWSNAKDPVITSMDLDVELDPASGTFVTKGAYTLANPWDQPMDRFALTPGEHFEDLVFTFQGKEYKPAEREEAQRHNWQPLPVENSAGLWVFRPEKPLAKGETATVQFSYHGQYPKGVGRNTRGADEFILPLGVVLNSFSTSFLPRVGYLEGVGLEPENVPEPLRPEADDWKKLTKAGFGTGAASNVVARVTVPEAYRANCPGVLVEERVQDGKRMTTWKTDAPVRFFNVVAGKWEETKGQHTSIFHLPAHQRNVQAMVEALDGARTWYSTWFYPYPWQDLRLSEFAGLASYAQGFATNIVFSESIGFLAKPTAEQDAPFLIVAHEAAHQWWGNILMPGDGPGGNILSEGLAHYSTARLMEQMRGDCARQAFMRGIEKSYVESREVEEERPMPYVDGMRNGDTTVTYDKGGWVFWMLKDLMGQEASDKGMQDFIRRYKDGPDYPLLQDFLVVMREHAPDKDAFDAFAKQWFWDVVLPEFSIVNAEAQQADGRWTTQVRLTNKGTGTVPVTVAVTNGQSRWGKDQDARAKQCVANPEYADARADTTVGPGQTVTVQIASDWAPSKVVIDPDVRVLQRGRKDAEAEVTRGSGPANATAASAAQPAPASAAAGG